jgi:hypothetical protein
MTTCHSHYIPDMEFSGLFDITHGRIIYLKYFLFIKYKNNIYIDIKGLGDVIMPFEEFSKYKLLKMFYELSLLLIENKNIVKEKINNREHNHHFDFVYTENRVWFIDCAYFIENLETNNKEVRKDRYCCRYNINPNDLINMEISTKSHIDRFKKTFLGYEQIDYFQKNIINYTKLAIDYNASLMEKELNELSTFFEDKKNIINLVILKDKEGVNRDIIRVIYNFLVSPKGKKKYSVIIDKIEDYKNKLEINTQILEA